MPLSNDNTSQLQSILEVTPRAEAISYLIDQVVLDGQLITQNLIIEAHTIFAATGTIGVGLAVGN